MKIIRIKKTSIFTTIKGLEEELHKYGKTQAWLARRLNISGAYMCDIVHGRRNVSELMLSKIEDLFKRLEMPDNDRMISGNNFGLA